MRNRQDEIRSKGFDITYNSRSEYDVPVKYGSIKTGTKTLDDAVLNLGSLRKIHRNYADKRTILKAIAERDLPLLREISNYFYNTNGIYAKACDYYAFLYRYDWYLSPEVKDDYADEKLNTKITGDFKKILNFLDNSHIQKFCRDVALEVVKNGGYYGYIVASPNGLAVQQLPINYCRSIYDVGGNPAIEFDMRFFDECFRDVNYRLKVLKLFPKEFQKGYLLYKQGKIEPDREHVDRRTAPYGNLATISRAGYWYLLDPGSTVKFSLSNGGQPILINAIPSLLDLDASQDLDRRKQMQQLLKIVIQELPLDKNGDLIFDVDEARDIHNNAVEMLQHAIGVDVLTTFADIKVEDMSDNNTTVSSDDLSRMERTVYNNLGISKNIFNTDSNLALEKSISDDESVMRSLLLQFATFFDRVVKLINVNKKKYSFRFYMLETTQYNFQNLSKLYKEQDQIGFSKMLPQIALGQSQSFILNTAYFENKVLNLSEIMIPPLMSSTLNAESILGSKNQSSSSKTNNTTSGEGAGRPEKEDGEKSEKTIANKESM